MLRLAIALVCAQCILQAQNTGQIRGKVIDAMTRQPIPKVHVGSNTGGSSGPFVGALTGVDGTYTLEDVPAGAIQMVVNLNGYKLIAEPEERGASFQLAAGETIRRDFVMHPQGRIYGRLVDRDTGKAIIGHTVSAVRKDAAPGRIGYSFIRLRTEDQKNGEFSIAGLDPGDYMLEIDSNEEAAFVFPANAKPKPTPTICYGQSWYPDVPRMDLAVPIHVGEGENRKVEISLRSRQTHSISGTLTAPHDWAEQPVAFTLQRNALISWFAMMHMPGTFRIDNLPPGSYMLGLIGGKPANGSKNPRDYMLADVNGRLEGKPIANGVGDYAFEVGDTDIDNFDVSLRPYAGVSAEIRMLEKDAKLPSKLAVQLEPAFSQIMANIIDSASPAEDGGFHQDGLHPGDYWPQLINLPKGFAVAEILFGGASSRNTAIPLDAPNTPLTIVLTSRPGAITGVVRDSEQNPSPGMTVVLVPEPFPDKVDPLAIQTQKSSEDGGFVFADLAPGKYRAFVLTDADRDGQGDMNYLRRRATAVEAIEIAAGQSVRVELKR